MKKYFLAIAAIILFTKGVYSQNDDNLQVDINVDLLAKSDTEQITNIDKIRQEIKANQNNLTKVEKFRDNVGYQYIYTKNKDLQLITVYYKDIIEDKNVAWYFQNGQLIYSEQISTERATNKIVDNEKFYFNNEHLFAWFKFDKQVNFTSPDFKKVGDDLNAYASKLKSESQSK